MSVEINDQPQKNNSKTIQRVALNYSQAII